MQTELELFDDAEVDDRADFEEAFYDLSSKIRELIERSSAPRNTAATSPMPSIVAENTQYISNVRLPKLDLPKFSGEYDEWFPFCDAFRSAIHSNPSLSNGQKLQYLRASTTGDAHKIISLFEIIDENYIVAWDLLNDRYDKRRFIVQSHLASLFELPVMKKESAIDILRTVPRVTSKRCEL